MPHLCLDEATFMDLLMGTLPPERSARVDEHLDTCVTCRRMVSEALKVHASGDAAAASPGGPRRS